MRFFPSFAEVLKAENKTIELHISKCVPHLPCKTGIGSGWQSNHVILPGRYLKRREYFRKKVVMELWLSFPSFHIILISSWERRALRSLLAEFPALSCGVCKGIRNRCLTHFWGGGFSSVPGSSDNCTKGYTGNYFTLFNSRTRMHEFSCGVCGSIIMVVEESWPIPSLGNPHGCDNIGESIWGAIWGPRSWRRRHPHSGHLNCRSPEGGLYVTIQMAQETKSCVNIF